MASVLVSHSGKQHAYRHALALQRLGCLDRFITSSYYLPDRWPDRLLARSPGLDRVLRRRHLDGLADRVVRQPLFELPEVVCRTVVGNGRRTAGLVLQRDVLFDRWVASTALQRRTSANVFWGFQGSCRDSLAAARACGLITVLELATGHAPAAERILRRERLRHPEWADSLSNAGFPRWYGQRLEAEPHEADYCIAASRFTRDTLRQSGVPDRRILQLPLGSDLTCFRPRPRSTRGPFQILFVGGVGQRKGIKYLLDAWNRIRTPNLRLVVVGPMVGSGRAFRDQARGVDYVGRVDTQDVLAHMYRSHVLVLPSLFEGFGLVLIEAMATGLPVIGSTHSAAPDLVRSGRDGFVLAPDDVDGLADRLTRLAEDRGRTAAMGVEAARRARHFGWDQHTERLMRITRIIVGRKDSTDGASERKRTESVHAD